MENIPLAPWKVMASLPYQADFSSYITEGLLINDRADAPYEISCAVTAEDGRVLHEEVFTGTAPEDLSFRAGSIRVPIPEDLTGSFTVRLTTVCGDFRGEKEYLMLIADLDIPVEPTAEDRQLMELYKTDGAMFTAKRASYRSVIRFADRWRQKMT